METEKIRLLLQNSPRRVSVFLNPNGLDPRGKMFKESAGSLIVAALIKAEEFSVKLGAMALIEEMINDAPKLHPLIFDALQPLLKDPSDLVLGDVAYLTGRLMDRRKIPLLEKLLTHSNSDIREIAEEGLHPTPQGPQGM